MRLRGFSIVAGGLAAIAATFVFAKVQGGFLPWFLFGFVLVFAAYEGIAFAVGLRPVMTERTLSAVRMTAGQSLQVRHVLRRRGVWPLFWLRVRDELPQRWVFQAEGTHRVLQPLWRNSMTFHYEIAALQRGVYRLGGTVLETGDLLGFAGRMRVDHRSDEVIVYPRVVPVRGWSGSVPEEFGLRQSTRRRSDESTNVIGVRDYVPGDRLSRIHWPASARKGILQAKEFELHVTSEWMFLPDLAKSSRLVNGSPMFELEMTIVASLIKHAYETHRTFGATLHGAQLTSFPAGTDEALFNRCMLALAMAAPDGRNDFPKTVQRVAQELPLGATLVVVSPRVDRESAVAAEVARRRTQVEWFVPVDSAGLTDAQRVGISMLQAARVNVYLIRTAEQLSTLQKGGGMARVPGV